MPTTLVRLGDGGDFPHPSQALRHPNGLLAVGGEVSAATMLRAYRRGIFPWFSGGEPVLWWSPDPRMILRPADFHLSRSLARTIRAGRFAARADGDFAAVVAACADRPGGTWIGARMKRAYADLYRLGRAHSVECYDGGGALVGGVFGVAIGGCFFGESMFSRVRDASKVALALLCRQLARWDFALFDCQVYSAHLASLGAAAAPRDQFLRRLQAAVDAPPRLGKWRLDSDLSGGAWRSL